MCADANFTGIYAAEDTIDPVSVISRFGVLFIFDNVPILWSCKLQSDISLSAFEAECIALSQKMRELVLTRRLLTGLGERTNSSWKNSLMYPR